MVSRKFKYSDTLSTLVKARLRLSSASSQECFSSPITLNAASQSPVTFVVTFVVHPPSILIHLYTLNRKLWSFLRPEHLYQMLHFDELLL